MTERKLYWTLAIATLIVCVLWERAYTWQADVNTPAVRGGAIQVTPTVPPPMVSRYAYPMWPWDQLAECESGGDWAINTGNGYYGGIQFSLTSWRAVGGTGYPHQATREEQIRRGELLQEIQGWGAWPTCSRKIGLR